MKVIIFDFGGVLAQEGFRNGLMAIARKNGLDPGGFFRNAREMIYETGYVSGKADEHAFWERVRQVTGAEGEDEELREEILKRFILRQEMLEEVDRLRTSGYTVVLLSDQTNWLDELHSRTAIYPHFDCVFNSYTMGKSKREASLFGDVEKQVGADPEQIVFIDDNPDNLRVPANRGWHTIHFTGSEEFKSELKRVLANPL